MFHRIHCVHCCLCCIHCMYYCVLYVYPLQPLYALLCLQPGRNRKPQKAVGEGKQMRAGNHLHYVLLCSILYGNHLHLHYVLRKCVSPTLICACVSFPHCVVRSRDHVIKTNIVVRSDVFTHNHYVLCSCV